MSERVERPGSGGGNTCRGCQIGWPVVPKSSDLATVAVKTNEVRLVCEEDTTKLHLPRAALIEQLGEGECLDAMIALLAIDGDLDDVVETVRAIVSGDLQIEEEEDEVQYSDPQSSSS